MYALQIFQNNVISAIQHSIDKMRTTVVILSVFEGELPMIDYKMLVKDMEALVRDIPYQTTALANAAALLFMSLNDVNWVGFYLMRDGRLWLAPFQGKPACTSIAIGKGVCGTCVLRRASLLVEDVHAFAGHIACDDASRSELVIPIFAGTDVVGVLDVDSPHLCRFCEEDRVGLEAVVKVLERHVFHGTYSPAEYLP